jgi:hypothetical protein
MDPTGLVAAQSVNAAAASDSWQKSARTAPPGDARTGESPANDEFVMRSAARECSLGNADARVMAASATGVAGGGAAARPADRLERRGARLGAPRPRAEQRDAERAHRRPGARAGEDGEREKRGREKGRL